MGKPPVKKKGPKKPASGPNTLRDRALGQAADEFSDRSAGIGGKLAEAGHYVADAAVIVAARGLKAVAAVDRFFVEAGELAGYGYARLKDRLGPRLAAHVEAVPEEDRISPDEAVAGPALEAARFVAEKPELIEMFATLLATAMDRTTASLAHPSFSDVIRQLSSDEARILNFMTSQGMDYQAAVVDVNLMADLSSTYYRPFLVDFSHLGRDAKVDHEDLTQAYISNLCRLGVCEIPNGVFLIKEELYRPLKEDKDMLALLAPFIGGGRGYRFRTKLLQWTSFGRAFSQACIASPHDASLPGTTSPP